jgi:hypothetical protein
MKPGYLVKAKLDHPSVACWARTYGVSAFRGVVQPGSLYAPRLAVKCTYIVGSRLVPLQAVGELLYFTEDELEGMHTLFDVEEVV